MERFRRVSSLWSWLPAFRAVAETQHLPTASAQLYVSASALSRTIRLLEEDVGRRLFLRNGRRIELNESGQRLLTAVRNAMRMIHEGLLAIDGTELSGPVHVATASLVTTAHVLPGLRRLRQEHPELVPHVLDLRETDVILMTLTLLDLSLAASLVLMMIFSGYENFVSKIDTGDVARPDWMGTLDFGGLKLKLVSSIVAISAVDLLKGFMNIGQIGKDDLMWKVITHLVFVVSGVLLALMDYITARAKAAAYAK